MSASTPAAARARRLKIAFGELVHLVGDDSDAAAIARVGRSAIARYRSLSPADAEFFAPVDVVADLERVAGQAVVTALLCEAIDGTFVALPAVAPSSGGLLDAMSQLSTEFNDATRAVCHGLADGNFCAADAGQLRDELDGLIRVAAQMRALANATMGGER